MEQAKVIGIVILAGLGLIIVLQNTEPVQTRLLFTTITMPRAALLFTTTVIGFCLGVLVSLLLARGANKDSVEKETEY